MFKKAIFFLFNLLLLIVPFIFTSVNQELFEFNKMLVVYGLTTLIASLWIMRVIFHKKIIFTKTKLDLPLALFLLSQIISTVFSIHPRTSIFGYYTRFHGGLLSTLAYITLYYALVSNLDRSQIMTLLKSSLLAGILVSLYAIPEHFGFSLSCALISGRFDSNCWVQDVQHRVFASLGQPNWLAAYLISLLPLAFVFYLLKKNNQLKKIETKFDFPAQFYFVANLLLFTALIFTKSRSGFLGLAAGIALVIGYYLILNFKLKISKKILVSPLSSLVISFLSLSLIFGTPFTPNLNQLWKKMNQPQMTKQQPSEDNELSSSLQRGTESGKIRQIVWQGALNIWKKYLLFGSGVETFAYSYYQHRPMNHNIVSEWDFLYNKAHNEFLNTLATTGIFGLVTYTWFLGSLAWVGFKPLINKTPDNKKWQDQLAFGLLGGITALTISNFLGFSTVLVGLNLFILAAAMMSVKDLITPINPLNKSSKNTRQTKPKGKLNNLSWQQISLLILTIFITLHFLLNVWSMWYADYIFTQGKSYIQLEEYLKGVNQLETAISLKPKEGLYHDELAETYAKIAAELSQINEPEAAQEFASKAIIQTNQAIRLNPVHLNFYQTRYRVFSHLSIIDSNYLKEAEDALIEAQALAPTHPRLVYNQALINIAQEDKNEAISLLEKAIEMKPNYIKARYKLANLYEQQNKNKLAKKQYQAILELVPSDENVKQRLKNLDQLGQEGNKDDIN